MRLSAAVSLFVVGTVLPVHAWAYIGPGAGLSALGTLLALLAAVALAVVGFVWYPIKRLMRRRKAVAAQQTQQRVDSG